MNTKIKTLTVKLSDAEIGRNAKLEHVRDLRDAGHPALHFRFSKNRARGSWYLLNKRRWHRIGAFPDLSAKQVLAALSVARCGGVDQPGCLSAGADCAELSGHRVRGSIDVLEAIRSYLPLIQTRPAA